MFTGEVTVSVGAVVSGTTGGVYVTVLVTVSELPAVSVAIIVIVLEPSARITGCEKEPPVPTETDSPSTVTEIACGGSILSLTVPTTKISLVAKS